MTRNWPAVVLLSSLLAACGTSAAGIQGEPPQTSTTTTALSPGASAPSPVPASTVAHRREHRRPSPMPPDVPMPNPALTPGAIQSSDTAAICTPGWASAHRDVSWETENAVAAEYGLSSHEGYEIDHLIPLELGGSNRVSNLWPEPYDRDTGLSRRTGWRTGCTSRSATAASLWPRLSMRSPRTGTWPGWPPAGRSRVGSATAIGPEVGAQATAGPERALRPRPSRRRMVRGAPRPHQPPQTAMRATTTCSSIRTSQARRRQPRIPATRGATRRTLPATPRIYLWDTSAGETITVRVGGASCTAPA